MLARPREGSILGRVRRLLMFLVRAYQRWLSPWLPDACRFHPTCSHYALEALRVHGVFKGGLLTCWRLLRCQPCARFGHDPVPPRGRWRHPDRHLTRDGASSSREERGDAQS